ncbi:MAG: PQQ-binding-like beta-propeller repeat protein [Candidatus Marsarchaeota archaeon]|nr:PQQ-binding-like beta-propeller repeat protein [Candidatus Marsarchaeota archaeon]
MPKKIKRIKRAKNGYRIFYIAATVIAVLFFVSIFYNGFSINASVDSCPMAIRNLNVYGYLSGTFRGLYLNGTQNSNFQFEYDACHLYYIDGSIGNFTYHTAGLTSNASVLGPVTPYAGMLFVPLSSPSPNYTYAAKAVNNKTFWGGILALNLTTGKQVWVKIFPDQIMTQPLTAKGLVYVGLGNGYGSYYNETFKDGKFVGLSGLNGVVALNTTTGKIVWYDPTIVSHMPSFVYYNNTLIVVPGAGAGKDSIFLYALNASSGKVKWKLFIGGYSAMSSPVFAGGNIYFGTGEVGNYPEFSGNNSTNLLTYNDTFFAVNLSTRSVIWSHKFNSNDGTQDSSPIYYNGIVVTGFDPLNSSAAPSNIPANVVINVNLAAFNAKNGSLLWTFYEGAGFQNQYINLPPLTAYDGVVYSDTVSVGKLWAVNLTTGKGLWSFNTGKESGNVNIYGSHIYVSNMNGTLFVLDLNGTLYKKINIGIGGGPENLLFMGKNILIYGIGNSVESIPVSKLLNLSS